MKDKNLRKQLWGYWYTQTNENGGPELIIDNKYRVPVSDGVVRYLLKRIEALEADVEKLKAKK